MNNHDLLNNLFELLRQVRFSSSKDGRCWRHELDGLFLVKAAYLVLEDGSRPQKTLPRNDIVNQARVWDSRAMTKVIVFSWQLLQDRVPTRPTFIGEG
jgi:hypothetical protein